VRSGQETQLGTVGVETGSATCGQARGVTGVWGAEECVFDLSVMLELMTLTSQ